MVAIGQCELCKVKLLEGELHDSHDVPCYLFDGNRKGRKNQADKFGRHRLCKPCHDKFELAMKLFLRDKAKEFSLNYFKEVEDDRAIKT